MANVRSGNTHWVDALGVLTSDSVKVAGITVTATAANAQVGLADSAGTTSKIELRVATSGETKHFDFSASPLIFPTGMKVTALANANATVIYTN